MTGLNVLLPDNSRMSQEEKMNGARAERRQLLVWEGDEESRTAGLESKEA